MIGIYTAYLTTAPLPITSSVALVSTGLTSPIAANATQKFFARVPFSVGATGGIRAQVVVPAGGTIFNVGIKLVNTVAPSITAALQVASAAFTNAAANAGNHWLEIEGTVVNGATAGNIDIQVAQNTSDALTLTVMRGATMEVAKL